MNNIKINFLLLLQLTLTGFFCGKTIASNNAFQYPFYIGGLAGYGSTTWLGLVPPEAKQNLAMVLSTPTEVEEGGATWGVMGGYEISPFFAVEASYIHYPDAKVYFDPMSLFSYMHDDLTEFTTRTEAVSLMAKIMLIIPKTDIRLFSSIGATGIHRDDLVYEDWRLRPSFGAGFNYNVTPRVMGEIAGNYTAGYGEAQLNPTEVYFPFLYSVTLRLAYRI